MKRATFIIIFLLPMLAFAQEKQQWSKSFPHGSAPFENHFKLPPLEEEYSNPHYHLRYKQGIRLSIRPSFDEDATYEFLYTDCKDIPSDRLENISKYIDIDNVLFRKYEVSNSSKEAIEKYYQDQQLIEKECLKKFPNFHLLQEEDEWNRIKQECDKEQNKNKAPENINIIITDKFIKNLHSKISKQEKRALYLFNNPQTSGIGFDGTTIYHRSGIKEWFIL